MTTLLFYFISRVAFRRSTALVGIATCVTIFTLQVHHAHVICRINRVGLSNEIKALSSLPQSPIVLTEGGTLHRLSFYAPRSLASRIVYLTDPDSAVRYLGQDTMDRGLLDLRPWFPMNVIQTASFVQSNPRFFVYGQSDNWAWITYDLSNWGKVNLLARGNGNSLLFSVDHARIPVTAAVLGTERARQADMLFRKLPSSGPSLCTLYLSPRDCPVN